MSSGAGRAAAAAATCEQWRPDDTVLYVARTGCACRQLPADFPPWQTVYWYSVRWERQRVTLKMLGVTRSRRRESSTPKPSRAPTPWA